MITMMGSQLHFPVLILITDIDIEFNIDVDYFAR